jgi:imidazolonepropionase-like amidohydrolase
MRNPSSLHRGLLAILPVLLCTWSLCAQEPGTEGNPPENAPAATPKPEAPPAKAPEPVIAIYAGTIHPVNGDELLDGTILIRGTRIIAIGKSSSVEVPDGATTLDFKTAHVYPGLVDALTDAFLDNATRGDGSLDAASALQNDLRARGDREDELVQNGITTAYVGNLGPAQWRGLGAIVRPQIGGYLVMPDKDRAALQARLTNGPGTSHPLQRQQQAQALFAAFDGLADYKKLFEDHKTELAKYQLDFAAYLAHFEKQNAKPQSAAVPGTPPASQAADGREAQQPGAGTGDAPPGGGRRGRRGGGGGGGGQQIAADASSDQDPKPAPAQDPKPAPESAPKPAAGSATPAATDKPPERPKFPKEPAHDLAKDVLLQVLDGKLPLRIEAHRSDEIRNALALAAEKKIPVVVLEQPFAAASCAEDIAKAGITCVLTGVWPQTLPKPYDDFDLPALPALLQAKGVAFAIATGSARRASALSLMAACAIGNGLDASAALRAITLTPAEILGVQQDTGSLEVGKLGDVLVCDRPLFLSDCRVLAVLSAGKTQFEAK